MATERLQLPLTKAQTLWFRDQKLFTQVAYIRARFHKHGIDPDRYHLVGFDFTPGTLFIPRLPELFDDEPTTH